MIKDHSDSKRKEGNVLFNDAVNTFYLRLYGVRHMVKDHSDSKRKEGNILFHDTQHTVFITWWIVYLYTFDFFYFICKNSLFDTQ